MGVRGGRGSGFNRLRMRQKVDKDNENNNKKVLTRRKRRRGSAEMVWKKELQTVKESVSEAWQKSTGNEP